jgi:hypothetical protein
MACVILLEILVVLRVSMMLVRPLRLDVGIVHQLGHSTPTANAIEA